MSARRRRAEALPAILIGLAALALYGRTLAPTVLPGDPGEFQLAAWVLGVPHPTGYPLYTLLGWAWSHLLPLGDPAYRMNLFSAVWGALAVGLLVPTAGALLRQAAPELPAAGRRLATLLAAATFAVTPTFWSQAVIAEVYTLHIFLVVLLLYGLLRWREAATPRARARWLLLAACAFGLGLAHHRTTLVLAPAIAAYLWLAGRSTTNPLDAGAGPEGAPRGGTSRGAKDQEDKKDVIEGPGGRAGRAAALAAAVGLPLLLYLYIPWRAPRSPYLRLPLSAGRELVLYDNTVSGFIQFVLGGAFGGSLDLSVNVADRLAMAARLLWAEAPWPGLIVALLGAGWLAGRRARWPLLALTGLTFGGTLAFNLFYTIGDIYVLFIPAYLAVVMWLAVGAGVLALGAARAVRRAGPRRAAAAAAVLVPLLALPAWLGVRHYRALDQSGATAARAGWEAILAGPLPERAVLVSNDRNEIVPMWYLQYVDGRRPDLTGLFPLITPAQPTLGEVLDLALGAGRPVYLIKDMPGLEVKVRTTPEAGLWRVTGPAAADPPRRALDARLAGAVRLWGYDQSPAQARPGQEIAIALYWEALRPLPAEYHSYVHVLNAAGDKVAQSDRQPGGVYYPSTLWRPGERLRDEHTLALPPGSPPGAYRLVVGLYALAADGTRIEPLGEPVAAGEIVVESAP